uniref:G-protein coupled receptors family 1 profile domain-containing protein n=1 Tax=Varanus komodoensis TaxID=61221 RepID=A0A8D2LSF0_VARKO
MTEMTPTTLWPQNNRTGCKFDSQSGAVTVYIISQFICLFGLLGNSIVLWFLRLFIRKNPIIPYIFSLALADAAYLLCCLVIAWCLPILILFKVELSSYSTGLYLLTVISVERCLGALCPFWYRFRRPEWVSSAVSIGLWSLAILQSGLSIFFLWERSVNRKIDKAINAFNLLICTPVMILSSLTLFAKVKCCSHPQNQPGHLHMTILLTVFFFVLCAVPLSVMTLFREYVNGFPGIFYLLASVNSSINPAIYFLVGCHRERWFREPLLLILQRALKEEKDSKRYVQLQLMLDSRLGPATFTTSESLHYW